MAGVCCFARHNPILHLKRIYGIKCCSPTPEKEKDSTRYSSKTTTPQLLKFAVSGVTELLRLFSSFDKDRFNRVSCREREEISVLGIDDLLTILKTDYENAYFVTGIFTSEIYAQDCIFEDPTIRFQGRELYSRNLRLLVPFFEFPMIGLQKIEKGFDSEKDYVLATWKLRTYLKLPWRPLISIDGSTVYELNDEFKIVRHAERWNVSALQAIAQIFTSNGRN